MPRNFSSSRYSPKSGHPAAEDRRRAGARSASDDLIGTKDQPGTLAGELSRIESNTAATPEEQAVARALRKQIGEIRRARARGDLDTINQAAAEASVPDPDDLPIPAGNFKKDAQAAVEYAQEMIRVWPTIDQAELLRLLIDNGAPADKARLAVEAARNSLAQGS